MGTATYLRLKTEAGIGELTIIKCHMKKFVRPDGNYEDDSLDGTGEYETITQNLYPEDVVLLDDIKIWPQN